MVLQIRQGIFETNSSSTHSLSLTTKGEYTKQIIEDIAKCVNDRLKHLSSYNTAWYHENGEAFVLEGRCLGHGEGEDDTLDIRVIESGEEFIQVAFTILFTKVKDYKLVNFENFATYASPLLHNKVPQYNWFTEVLKAWLDDRHPGYGDIMLGERYNAYCGEGYRHYDNEIPDLGYYESDHIEEAPLYEFFYGAPEVWDDENAFKDRLAWAFDNMGDMCILDKKIPDHWYCRVDIERI